MKHLRHRQPRDWRRPRPCRPDSPLLRAAALAAVLALGGCAAVGPDFTSPALPAAAHGTDYTATPLPEKTAAAAVAGGAAQEWVRDQDIPAQWWQLFRSEALDRLIREALERSPSLAAAEAILRQARENFEAQSGRLAAPAVDAQLGVQRARSTPLTTGVPGGTLLTVYNGGLNVSYALDAFGGVRRQLEGAQAAVDVQRYQLEAVYLTLTGNIVSSAIRVASLRAQRQALHEVLQAQQAQLDLLQQQFDVGAIPLSTVLAQRTQVAQTAATLPALEKSLAQARHQLAVYAGRLPSEPGLPDFDLADLELPTQLPLSLPSQLARQRPDVRASEAQLHQASAQVGVATANLYPQIQLSAGWGRMATTPADLIGSGGASFWSLASGLTQPLFHGGALRAQQRAAVAAYDAAAAQYRQTVLGAFQNVADALRAIEADAAGLAAQASAEALARQSLDMAAQQYRAGAISYVSLLTAQQAWLQTHSALVQAQAARYADTAALFQALGGGWWNRADLADISAAPHTGTLPDPHPKEQRP